MTELINDMTVNRGATVLTLSGHKEKEFDQQVLSRRTAVTSISDCSIGSNGHKGNSCRLIRTSPNGRQHTRTRCRAVSCAPSARVSKAPALCSGCAPPRSYSQKNTIAGRTWQIQAIKSGQHSIDIVPDS